MVNPHGKVKKIPGRVSITDDKIKELIKAGWWDTQIRNKYKVGIPRLRTIRRAMI